MGKEESRVADLTETTVMVDESESSRYKGIEECNRDLDTQSTGWSSSGSLDTQTTGRSSSSSLNSFYEEDEGESDSLLGTSVSNHHPQDDHANDSSYCKNGNENSTSFAIKVSNTKPTSAKDIQSLEEKSLVQPKSLPSPSGTYKVICVSFLEPNIATSVANTVMDEALRVLKSGGLLYVVDSQGIVPKLPMLRQLLKRIDDDDETSVQFKKHDIETQEILLNNGFAAAPAAEDIVRWMGTKP